MLSLDRCRALLGGDGTQSDGELGAIRDQLYTLARLAVASYSEVERLRATGRDDAETGEFTTALALLADAQKDEILERAAIIEFDGSIGRRQAERRAVQGLLARKRRSRK